MANRRESGTWWIRVKSAAGYGTAFANNWQWVWGVPFGMGVVGGFGGWAVFSSHPIAAAFGVGLLGFVFTWIVVFALRVFMVPFGLLEEEQRRGDDLQEQLHGIGIERERIAAMIAQTEEMRLTRLQQQRAADPFVKAMSDVRKQAFAAGMPLDEWGLGLVVHWITANSA